MVYPDAVLRGESVLHNAGWTTQIPQRLNIAVLERRSYITINEATLAPKKQAWYNTVRPYLLRPTNRDNIATFGFPALPPALALADLYSKSGIKDWHPGPDDLDIEDSDWKDVKKAFDILELAVPERYREFVN